MIKDENKHAYKLLERAGWSENRRSDENLIKQQIMSEGYPLLPAVVDFMKNFGGLVIYFQNKRNRIQDDINLDFEHATHLETTEKIIIDYKPRIGKSLCPVGTAYRDHFVLLMSEDGNLYGAYEDYLCYISDSGIGGIEAIVTDKDFLEI